MNVAFISTVNGRGWPGSEFLWGETAARLLLDGHSVFARCSAYFKEQKTLQKLLDSGLVYDPTLPLSSRLGKWKARLCDPFSRLKKWNPDIVVVSAGSAFDISYSRPLARYLLETKVPFVPICHFNAETFWVENSNRETMRCIYAKAAKAVFVAADNLRLTERQLAMRIPNFQVIRPPLPIQSDAPLPWPETSGKIWNFACVARWDSRWKGQDVLFEVLARPEWRERNWRLNLYGAGGEEMYLKELANFYGIADKVKFVGFVEDRARIWLENHIQVFPTRGEGGPMVLTEGMACGRVAVIADCGNAREYVEDDIDGFLAEFATPEIFAKAMERAWAKRHVWEDMGKRAHAKIALERGFDPAADLREVIIDIIGISK